MAIQASGRDFWAQAMGIGDAHYGETGTATSTSATSLTNTGASFPNYANHMVVAGTTYGVIASNTGTVLTIDKWYTVASPGGAAASTPSGTSNYVILPTPPGAAWIALTANTATPSTGGGDTSLTGEITTAGGGLVRAFATPSHTAGTNTYVLTKTFTANGSDSLPVTIAKIGVFCNATQGATTGLVFETLLSTTVTLSASGDNVQISETVSGT